MLVTLGNFSGNKATKTRQFVPPRFVREIWIQRQRKQRINSLLKHEEEDKVRWHLDESTEEDIDVSAAGQLASAQCQPVVDQRYRHPVYEGVQ